MIPIETLLDQCRSGDELAWEALVRRCQGRVFALAFHYLRDREEARDVAQEAFIRVYRALPRFDPGGSFHAWLVRITRNIAIDRLRTLHASPAYDGRRIEDSPAVADDRLDPEHQAVDEARRALIYRALDRMTEINREMILLKDIQGLKQREIADILAIPIGTVKARTNRARLELAERILELEPSYGAVP